MEICSKKYSKINDAIKVERKLEEKIEKNLRNENKVLEKESILKLIKLIKE